MLYSPENLDIYKEMEITYMASLLKKKAQSIYNPESLKSIH